MKFEKGDNVKVEINSFNRGIIVVTGEVLFISSKMVEVFTYHGTMLVSHDKVLNVIPRIKK